MTKSIITTNSLLLKKNKEEVDIILKRLLYKNQIKWLIGSDALLEVEDIYQESYVFLLEHLKLSVLLKNHALLTTSLFNFLKDLGKRNNSLRKGGSGRQREVEEISVLSLDDEDFQHLEPTSSTRYRLFVAIKATLIDMKEGTDNEKLQMLVDYYAFGLTYEQLAKEYGYSHKASVKTVLDRYLDRMKPELKACIEDLEVIVL
jgi:DNA-directed RNA polymerase specialized sigma24 family protein